MLVTAILEVHSQNGHLMEVAVSFLSIVAANQLDDSYILIVPNLPRLRPALLSASLVSR